MKDRAAEHVAIGAFLRMRQAGNQQCENKNSRKSSDTDSLKQTGHRSHSRGVLPYFFFDFVDGPSGSNR